MPTTSWDFSSPGLGADEYLTDPPDDSVPLGPGLSAATYPASSSSVDTDFTAKLVDLHPNGYAQNLLDGIIRARYRESASTPKLMESGKPYLFTIDLWATSNVFLPGHRIRLEISSSNFPRFDRNTNTGHELGLDGPGDALEAEQRVLHDPSHPSALVLPIAR